jgi:hypothetical protein
VYQSSVGSLSSGDLGFDNSILGATRLGELMLDMSLLGLEIIPLERSRRNRATTDAKSFATRIGIGIGRLYIFLIIFGVANIRQRYNNFGAIDFVSKTFLFTTFYFFTRRYSETILLEKARGG